MMNQQPLISLNNKNLFTIKLKLIVLASCLSLLTGCFSMLLDYSREQEIVRGEIQGRIIKDENQEAIRFAKIEIIGRSNIKRSNIDGEFNFADLDIGTYVLKIEDDIDGDGWPERTGTSIAQISQLAHSGDSPFSKETHSIGVFLGDISLKGMTAIQGKVQVNSSPNFVSPSTLGYLSRVFITQQKDFNQEDFSEEFNMGAENITSVDSEGNYSFGSVSSGDLYVIASLHEAAENGRFGKTIGISKAIKIQGKPNETIKLGTIFLDDPLTIPLPPKTPVGVLINPTPKSNSYAVYTLLGQEIPPCETEVPTVEDYLDGPFSHVKKIFPLNSIAGKIAEYDAPLGIWNMLVCSGGKGGVMSKVAFGELDNAADRPLLGPIHLGTLSNQNCSHNDIIDCNQNGRRALPTYNPKSIANYTNEINIWQECAKTCGTKIGHSLIGLFCEVDNVQYDCDDDADDQSDTSESPECHGLGKGTDLDADGICSVVDAFPRCPLNQPALCPAGIETVRPTLAPGLEGGIEINPPTFEEEYGNQGTLKVTADSKVHFLKQIKVPTSLGATYLLGRDTSKEEDTYYPFLFRVADSAADQQNSNSNLLDDFVPNADGNNGVMVNSMAYLSADKSGSQDLLLIAGNRNSINPNGGFDDKASIFYRQASDGQQIAGVQDINLQQFSLDTFTNRGEPITPRISSFTDIESDGNGAFYVSGYYGLAEDMMTEVGYERLIGFILKLKWDKNTQKLVIDDNFSQFYSSNVAQQALKINQLIPTHISFQNGQLWVSALFQQDINSTDTFLTWLMAFSDEGENIEIVERADIVRHQTTYIEQEFYFYQLEEGFGNNGYILVPTFIEASKIQTTITNMSYSREHYSRSIPFAPLDFFESTRPFDEDRDENKDGMIAFGQNGSANEKLSKKLVFNGDNVPLNANQRAHINSILEIESGYLVAGAILTGTDEEIQSESVLWRFNSSAKLERQIDVKTYVNEDQFPKNNEFSALTFDKEGQILIWGQNYSEGNQADLYGFKYNLKSVEQTN